MPGATFGLVTAERVLNLPDSATTTGRDNSVTQRPVAYLDYTADGQRVVHLLGDVRGDHVNAVGDYVSAIQEDGAWPQDAVASIRRLLGEDPSELPDGRASLYVCPECADRGCGAVTTTLVVRAKTVTWQSIGFQHDYDDSIESLYGDDRFPTLTFERLSYEAVLRAQLARFQARC